MGIYDCTQDMTGKTVLITGGTSGIGLATAKDLARRNARVILPSLYIEEGNDAAKEIISSTGNTNVVVKHLDLSSLSTVRKCAEDILNTEEKLHVLINNAGIIRSHKRISEDGYEMVMQTNYLGHFLLTLLLLDLLKKSAPSRIINVASISYKFATLNLDDFKNENSNQVTKMYSKSKLALVLFTKELASRLINSGVTVNVLHPGLVKSDILMSSTSVLARLLSICFRPVLKTCEEGAQTSIYLAVHPDVETTTGKYFEDCREKQIPRRVLDKVLAKTLFEASEDMVGALFK